MNSFGQSIPNHDYQLTPEVIDSSSLAVQDTFRAKRETLLERTGNTEYIEKQGDGPVTASDKEIEEALQEELERLYPGLPAYGEETGYGDNLPGVFWLIDPVDGTKSFIEGIPTFTCMAVLIENGKAIASVIYNPSSDEMYTAQKGKGAYKNGVRIDLSKQSMPARALCKGIFIDELNGMLESQGVICEEAPAGGGFGFTMVLDGLVAARFNLHPGGHPHDYAPGALLVREAGGYNAPIRDNPDESYEALSFVACHPALALAEADLERLRSLEKPRRLRS